jgi:hypothetical protein
MMKKFCHFRRPTQLHGYTEDMLLTVTPLAFSQIEQPYLKNLGRIPTPHTWYPYERLAEFFSRASKELAAGS